MARPWKSVLAPFALILAVSMVGCQSSADTSGQPVTTGDDIASPQGGVSGDFRQADLIVAASCTGGSTGGGLVEVDGWDPRTWKHEAHTEFRLPEVVATDDTHRDYGRGPYTALRELCDPEEPADEASWSDIRSLFDQNFTKVAVVIEDRASGVWHVGYVDRSGQLTDLTGDEDSFGREPREENAVLSADGQTVWFNALDDTAGSGPVQSHVASRPVSGDHEATQHWKGAKDTERGLITMGNPTRVALGFHASLAPDGKHVEIDGHIVPTPDRPGVIPPDIVDTAQSVTDGQNVTGWIDNDTVLSDLSGNFYAVDITPKAKRSAPILPDNDRKNMAMVPSPDGRQIVFQSRQNDSTTFYVVGTEPGSTPTQIKDDDRLATLGKAAVFIEWR